MKGDEALNKMAGNSGFRYLTSGTHVISGRFIVCDTISTYSALSKNGDDLPQAQRAEGIVVAGEFTSITISTGSVRVY